MMKKVRIVLADDHSVICDALSSMLGAEADLKVVGQGHDGLDAYRKIVELNPDLAIVDVMMPRLNGIELTERVSEQCPETRVIILSMHADSEHIFRALQAGARGYVLKASAGEELLRAVRAVLDGRRYLAEAITDTVVSDYVSGDSGSPLNSLSAREREVLQLQAEGHATREIARLLDLSAKTVETYKSRIKEKLGIRELAGLVKFAIRHGLTGLD